MALKLERGKHPRRYQRREELADFGRRVCHVAEPEATIDAIRAAMHAVMRQYRRDERLHEATREPLFKEWNDSIAWYTA